MSEGEEQTRPLRLVLPGGALGAWTRDALHSAGLTLSHRLNESGELHTDDSEAIRAALGCSLASISLPEADVPIYVEHGVVDLGVVRTHLLHEADVKVYRPFTFGFEAGEVALVAREGVEMADLTARPYVRIATPYRRFARSVFASRGWNVELIPLSREVSLAPLLGLSDAVLMLVEDPRALADMGLAVVESLGPTRAKLIANRATGHGRIRVIERLVARLRSVSSEGAQDPPRRA